MPRPSLTPEQRASAVIAAADNVLALTDRAHRVSAQNGYGHPDAIEAWDAVEQAGATIHRQARLLAGKSRGG